MASKRNKDIRRQALYQNSVTLSMHISNMVNIATSIYKWDGLPDTVSERVLERALILKGQAIFFDEPDIGIICLPAMPSGQFNIYGNCVSWTAFGYNGFTRTLGYNEIPELSESIICYNNSNRQSDYPIIDVYATKLYELDRSIDINISLQKFPVFIATTKEQELSMRNFMMDYSGNVPMVYGTSMMDLDNIKSIDFKVPYVADKLMDTKHQILYEMLTLFGVENSSVDKRERVQSAEVDSNMGWIQAQRAIHLQPRQLCADQLNAKYGLNATVGINHEFVNMMRLQNVNQQGGGLDGSLYDGVTDSMPEPNRPE